jgi:uncharacterized caspase-like protein
MKLYGVFIGIDKYLDPKIHSLKYAKFDAQQFYGLFEQKLSSTDRTLWLLIDQQATKLQIEKTIGESVSRLAREDDIVLLHFSGHGSPEAHGSIDTVSRYLIAYDTEYGSIFATGIDMGQELKILFQRIRSKLVFFFIDSCFSGLAGGRTFEGPGIRRALGYRGTISLQKLNLGEGRLVMAACDDNQVAREDAKLGHGIFTYYLLQSLTNPEYISETISIGQVYDQVYLNVKHHTGGRQTPILNGRNKFAQMPMLV